MLGVEVGVRKIFSFTAKLSNVQPTFGELAWICRPKLGFVSSAAVSGNPQFVPGFPKMTVPSPDGSANVNVGDVGLGLRRLSFNVAVGSWLVWWPLTSTSIPKTPWVLGMVTGKFVHWSCWDRGKETGVASPAASCSMYCVPTPFPEERVNVTTVAPALMFVA